MGHHDNLTTPQGEVVDLCFGEDVYARAWQAVANCQMRDLVKMPSVDIDVALSLVSKALMQLATTWPVLEPVRTALDLTRTFLVVKESVRRRIAGLRLKQAELLCDLFRLRDFKPEPIYMNGQRHSGDLTDLCDLVRKDIQYLGNLIENYIEESWLGRVLKEKGWKNAVIECGNIVAQRKEAIHRFMTHYAAKRSDQILAAVHLDTDRIIAELAKRVPATDDAVVKLFDLTDDEARVLERADHLEGLESCIKNDAKLMELAEFIPANEDVITRREPVKLPGEDSAKRDLPSKANEKTNDKKPPLSLAEIRRIRTPVAELLQESLARFESRLDFLITESKRNREALRAIMTFASGLPYERIRNDDIKKLWKDMGWAGSIDSKTFVLNLYDYFIDLERESHTKKDDPSEGATSDVSTLNTAAHAGIPVDQPRSRLQVAPSSPLPPVEAVRTVDFPERTMPHDAARDAWCLRYFNYRTLSTFTEVLDDDLNGLIKIKEVNGFISAKPEKISLMQWTAYCAYGWLISAHIYRLRIEYIIEKMLRVDWAKENSQEISSYTSCLRWVVAFLRPIGEPTFHDDHLLRVVHTVMDSQEEALVAALEPLGYDLEEEVIRSMMNLSLYQGPGEVLGRIEGNILPVLFLVIRHHYRLTTLGKTHLIRKGVFDRAYRTVDYMTDLLFDRVRHLMDRFSKPGNDEHRIQSLANGMFCTVQQYLQDGLADSAIAAQLHQPWLGRDALHALAARLSGVDPKFVDDLDVMSIPIQKYTLCRLVDDYEEVASHMLKYGIRLASETTDLHHTSIDQRQTSTEISGTDKDDPQSKDEEYHFSVSCDGCNVWPIKGLRFKCVDCDNFDYCSVCVTADPPPLRQSHALGHTHTSQHRFLVIKRWFPEGYSILSLVSQRLRGGSPSEDPELAKFDPLIEHCLSASNDIVRQASRALAAYRRQCLQLNDDEVGVRSLEVLESTWTVLSHIPGAEQYAKSRSDLWSRMRDDYKPLHQEVCDGTYSSEYGWRIVGDCYTCVDCQDDNVNFCAQCFSSHQGEHANGRHRFLLLRYPTPRTTVKRIKAEIKYRTRFDRWTLASWCQAFPPQVDSEDTVGWRTGSDSEGDAMDGVDSEETRCSACREGITGGAYPCLTCELFHNHGGILLCSACAYMSNSRGHHQPTHVLAVAHTEDLRADREEEDASSIAAITVKDATITDLSKRLDAMEQDILKLVSMVGTLNDNVLLLKQEGSATPQGGRQPHPPGSTAVAPTGATDTLPISRPRESMPWARVLRGYWRWLGL